MQNSSSKVPSLQQLVQCRSHRNSSIYWRRDSFGQIHRHPENCSACVNPQWLWVRHSWAGVAALPGWAGG